MTTRIARGHSMKAWVGILLVTAALVPLVPLAQAHQCNGGINACGDCVKGEVHNHNDARGQCSSGPGYYSENGYGGQRAEVPALALPLVLVGLLGAALVVGRRA